MTKRLKMQPTQMAVAFRHIKPSWRHYIDYVEQAAREKDKEMALVYQAFCGLSARERESIMPEQLCELAGVKPSVLFASVCGMLWQNGHQEANLITAIAYPKVMERTAKNAITKAGENDRRMFHTATGFLKTPNGPSITINNTGPQTAVLAPGTDRPLMALPSMEAEVLSFEDLVAPPSRQIAPALPDRLGEIDEKT